MRDRASGNSIMVTVGRAGMSYTEVLYFNSVKNLGEDSGGGDELLLRLALVQALLEGRREAEALEEAR